MKFTLSSVVAALLATTVTAEGYEYVKAANPEATPCTTFQFYKAHHHYKPTSYSTKSAAPTTSYKPKPTTHKPKPKPTKHVVYTTIKEQPKPTPTPVYGGGGGGGGGSSSGLSADQKKALDIHNQARAANGCSPLEWDHGLAASAENWARSLTGLGHLQHSQGGENLYWSSGMGGSPLADGSHAWVNEKPSYHGETIPQGSFESYGHYTQCVWKSTTKVGVALAKDSKGGVYVVAHYSPAGNMVGQKPF